MRFILALVLVGGCSLYGGESAPLDAGAVAVDAAPVCESTVVETCGPRPPRPAVDTEQWSHDVDLWAKCAAGAEPRVQSAPMMAGL